MVWVLPPKGMRTDPAPMEPSNRSTSPRRLAHFRLDAISRRLEKPTELAISESQERMAVVVSPEDEEQFIAMAQAENLEA